MPGISQCFLCGKGGGPGKLPISSNVVIGIDSAGMLQCFLCAPKELVPNSLKVPLSVSGDESKAGDKGTDDKPGNISPSETLDILGD